MLCKSVITHYYVGKLCLLIILLEEDTCFVFFNFSVHQWTTEAAIF